MIEDALTDDSIWATTDDIVALTQPLLEGLVLTHRLTAGECLLGEIPVTPDLVILDWDADDTGLALDGGGRLVHRMSQDFVPGFDGSTLVGPDGWLDGFVAGDLVAFTRAGGAVRVERVAEAAEDALEVGLLRDAAEKRIPNGSCEEAAPMLLDALVADPAAFRRPVRPVDDLLAAAGFERRGFSFGRAGEEWKSAGEQVDGQRRRTLTTSWGFSGCCHQAFSLVNAAFAAFVTDPADVDLLVLAGALRHGTVAMAFAESGLGSSAEGAEALRRFADAVLDGAPLKRSSASLLLLALEAERRGDAVAAEDALRGALRADPDYGSAAAELVDYEIDRGDIHRALALLRHPGIGPDRHAIRLLEKLRSDLDARRAAAGRNDRCPCGSGRKFKVCCQRTPTLPLSSRLGLLMTKLDRFGHRPHRRHVVFNVALWACDPGEPDPVAAREAMAEDPVIADFATFEGGIALDYLAERGHLVPPDERDLLHAVVGQPRCLWEVTAVAPGASLTLRDTASGEELVVEEHLGSVDREPGALILARVAEVDGERQLFGAVIEVPLRLRASALQLVDAEPDVEDLASWYGQAMALPTLVTRDGEPVILCRVEMTTALDRQALRAVLDDILEPEGDDTWLDLTPDSISEDERTMRGTVRLDDGRLCIDTNAEARLERLLEMLAAAVPDAAIVVDERTDPRAAILERRSVDLPTPVAGAALPADQAAFLDELIRTKEAAWVDEAIPALGGLTPKQALDDPTRREDLLSLLREMDTTAGPSGGVGFDPSRLRALLNL